MTNEVFNLSMMDFKQTAYLTLKRLISDTDFQDVTLCTEDGQSIKAHKVVLSSFSQVFQNILKTNHHPHPLLFLSNVTMNELRNVLTFMYLGEAKIPVGEYNRFIEVAKRFQIYGIAGLDAFKEYQELESFSCPLKESKNRESFTSKPISNIKVEDCDADKENMNDSVCSPDWTPLILFNILICIPPFPLSPFQDRDDII